jgi:hypothetical protein
VRLIFFCSSKLFGSLVFLSFVLDCKGVGDSDRKDKAKQARVGMGWLVFSFARRNAYGPKISIILFPKKKTKMKIFFGIIA